MVFGITKKGYSGTSSMFTLSRNSQANKKIFICEEKELVHVVINSESITGQSLLDYLKGEVSVGFK